MIERVSGYYIYNNPDKAWDIISNEIKSVTTDIFIIGQNLSILGEIPYDIQADLKNLIKTANNILDKQKEIQ